jgi:hypothetical protein
MHELLVILQNCAVHEEWSGRRNLRPGAIYNADERTARWLLEKGFARRLVEPAPLFVDATAPRLKPKRGRKEGGSPDGGIRDGTHDAP